ncbi:MAG TPA: SPO1 DNA polymerase [Gammaproteobacteria bacterium]|nr:SPO1 DNA polymerase [Gammaproteobacteria bacterium]
MKAIYDRNCRACPRLAAFLDDVRARYPDYHFRPVAPFGDAVARLLIVGLAPGMHGANASGRPFTGDHAGILLYRTLHDFGFGSRPESRAADDGLELRDARITNAVKCLPPGNKPVGAEINTCNAFLANELETLPAGAVVLALGGIAHRAIVKALSLRQADYRFAHAAEHRLTERLLLLDSYHCSRYNTNTRRLTEAMFRAVFARARELLNDPQA